MGGKIDPSIIQINFKRSTKCCLMVLIYGRYIYRVLKKKHDDMGISAKAVDILNGMVYNWLHMIASQAGILILRLLF